MISILDKIPTRLNIGLMLLFTMFFLYVLRSNLSIIMLAMIQLPPVTYDNGTVIESPDYGPRYNWSAYDQSLILGAYFYGYSIASFPFGLLIDKYNLAKANIGYAFSVAVVLTIATPFAAESFAGLIVLRILLGFVSGGVLPAITKLIGQWSPPNERGKFLSTIFGADIGTVTTWIICGVLIESLGWHSAFFGCGILAAIFVVIWCLIVFESPAKHPRILKSERDYIENSQIGFNNKSKSWPPILLILKSLPFWSLFFLYYGNSWGANFLITASPKFMTEILGLSLSSAGFLSSLPYLARLVMGPLFGTLGDFIKTKQLLPTNLVRKGFLLFSHIIPGILMLSIPYVGSNPYACIACITVAFASNGAISLTSYANLHDLSPNFAGSIISTMNAVGVSAGFISPIVVAHFTAKENTINTWGPVFIISAWIYIVPALLFILLGSTEIQKWNEPKRTSCMEADEIDSGLSPTTTITNMRNP